ncbi:hypothetical protein SteCoe_30726 [Stentor coeruleus]|uniref:Uncharacterized protein n=1 Tax=Stentor coeruleus TaxID=5963 RepID=A0A1R2B2X8_9CILI|nr:hypothetical protein SteCoe_30726 [Stentor coeruleus]
MEKCPYSTENPENLNEPNPSNLYKQYFINNIQDTILTKLNSKKQLQLYSAIQGRINLIQDWKETIFNSFVEPLKLSYNNLLDASISELITLQKKFKYTSSELLQIDRILNNWIYLPSLEILLSSCPNSSEELFIYKPKLDPTKIKETKEMISKEYNLLIEGHVRKIICMCLSDDNRYLVTGSEDKTIRIWDIIDNRQISIISGHESTVTCISLSLNNTFIVSGSTDCTIRLWDFQSKDQRSFFNFHSKVNCLVIAKNDTIVVVGFDDNFIRVLDLVTKHEIQSFYQSKPVNYLVISYDTQKLISASRFESLKCWDLNDFSNEDILKSQSESTICLSIAKNGHYIIYGNHIGAVIIVDLKNKSIIKEFKSNKGRPLSVAITENSTYAVASFPESIIKIYNLSAFNVETINTESKDIKLLSVTNDQNFCICLTYDGLLSKLNLSTKEIEDIRPCHSYVVTCFTFTQNGQFLATGSGDAGVRIWNLWNKTQELIVIHRDWVSCVKFSPDDKILAIGSWDKVVTLWNVKEGKVLEFVDGHNDKVKSLGFTKDSKYLVVEEFGRKVRVWKIKKE